VVPVFYSYMEGLSAWLKRRRHAPAARPAAAATEGAGGLQGVPAE